MPMTNGDGAPSRLKVAVDAMGGDHGPRVVVEGAVAAVREFGAAVILVGDRSAIHREVVRLEAESLGLDSPRVGLLSVGEEEGKGNELTKETYEQLRESSLNFVGNVEGRDIYNGRCDVIVTDGFTGNVALKISESLAEMIGAMIKEELMRDARSKIGAKLAMPAFERFRRRIDYTEMGGAPLLGIDGAAIICHGASPVKAIKNAVRVAQEWASAGLNERSKSALEAEEARREGGRE